MSVDIEKALGLAWSEYREGRLTESELNQRLSDIQAAIRVQIQVHGERPICPDCKQPMYRHHIC